MPTISQKELRTDFAQVLRRAEAGEEFTITAFGHPIAQLEPARSRQWVPGTQLADLWRAPADPTLEEDLGTLGRALTDP